MDARQTQPRWYYLGGNKKEINLIKTSYEKISIDAVNGGTMLRFVNDLEDHNLTVLNVPIRN